MIVEARAPFLLEATVRLLQRRPSNLLDRFEAGRWSRLFDLPQGPALLQVEQIGPGALRLTSTRSVPASTVRRMLGLEVDLSPFHRAATAIPALAPLAEKLQGIRPPRFASLFEAILGVIPFQQLSLDAGMATFSRLVKRYGLQAHGHFAAPRPEAIAAADPRELRSLGLAVARARALQLAAEACADGSLDEAELEALPTPEARKRLLALQGIGPWSANLVLLRGLGRLEVFPPGDVGVARGLKGLLGPELDLERLAASFAPQQGMLYFLSLAAWQLERGLLGL